jgi:putative transposase
VNYPVKPYRRFYKKLRELELDEWKLKKTATLIKRGEDFYIALTLEKRVKKRKPKRPRYILNVDLNVQRNLACIGIFEIDWERKESKLYGVKFINGEIMRLVCKRDYLLEEIRKKQALTGRSPKRGDNRKLWNKVYNLSRDIALKVAKEINDVALDFKDTGEVVVVFEKLKGLRGKKGRGRKLNRKLNYWMRRSIVERVEYLSFEKGYAIDFVYPHYTSKRCSVCGSEGERFSPKGSKALFGCARCGYEVNADINAVFNQHFVYLSHLLHGGGKARSVVRVGISLKSGVPKATATNVY